MSRCRREGEVMAGNELVGAGVSCRVRVVLWCRRRFRRAGRSEPVWSSIRGREVIESQGAAVSSASVINSDDPRALEGASEPARDALRDGGVSDHRRGVVQATSSSRGGDPDFPSRTRFSSPADRPARRREVQGGLLVDERFWIGGRARTPGARPEPCGRG